MIRKHSLVTGPTTRAIVGPRWSLVDGPLLGSWGGVLNAYVYTHINTYPDVYYVHS